MTRPRVAGIILAAGASRRLGEPKQLLPICDRPMLRHVVDAALASRLAEVVLVLGARADAVRDALQLQVPESGASGAPDLRVVDCADWERGMSASLRTGISRVAADTDAVAILLGDQPDMTAGIIDAVLAAFADGDRPIARPVFGPERTPGHPVVIRRELFPQLRALHGDSGARRLIAARPGDVLDVRLEAQAPHDIDTRADYAAAIRSPDCDD